MSVTPASACLRFLNRNSLLFKQHADGFSVLFESLSSRGTQSREDLEDNETILRFVVTLNDALFYNYTSGFGGGIADRVMYFHNDPALRTDAVSDHLLHDKEFVERGDSMALTDVKENFRIRPFALIDIKLLKGLPADFTIQFREKNSYWRYHLVSEHLKELQSPGILGPEVFEGPEQNILPDRREALSFVSKQPISLADAYPKAFQLVENYEPGANRHRVVIKALPCPNIANISALPHRDKQVGRSYSEIFI